MINSARLLIFLLIWGTALGSPVFGQLIVGQYEEEAPLGSWNAPGALSAAALGLGGTATALAFDTTCLIANPALLTRLPRFSAAVSGSRTSAALFRYGLVNTGVLDTYENPVAAWNCLDFAGFSFRTGGWTAGFSVHSGERYDRPPVDYSYQYGGRPLYNLKDRQSGFLRIGTFGLARRLGPSIGAGLALHFARGTLEREFEEQWIYSNVRITDERSRRFDGFSMTAGMTYDAARSLTLALVVSPPSTLNARSRSLLRYEAPLGRTDIRIAADTEDEIHRPWRVGAGAAFTPSAVFRLAAEITVVGWSAYRIRSFGEDLERSFRNTTTVRIGGEYRISQRIFGRSVFIPLRAGAFLDPQPMREPRSAYGHLTLGSGLESGPFRAAFAFSIGRERGSGHSLSVARGALSLGYEWGDGR